MSEERDEPGLDKPQSDWRAVGLCLAHVGVLFVPVAVCLLLLAGVTVHKSATAGTDPVETGSIARR